jgi:hypothetical protein
VRGTFDSVLVQKSSKAVCIQRLLGAQCKKAPVIIANLSQKKGFEEIALHPYFMFFLFAKVSFIKERKEYLKILFIAI